MNLECEAVVVHGIGKESKKPYTAIKIVVYDEKGREVISKFHFPTPAEKMVLGIEECQSI